MTAEVEQQLHEMVRQFGVKKVRDALTPLINKCAWNDWHCVATAIERIATRHKAAARK
jgi:hypothetical protein